MLLYLTSNENLGLFDFLTDEKGMLVKKLSGKFSLNKFVVHDMRNLNHFSYIAIDLESLTDDKDNIVEAIKAFNAMYDSRIILFAEKADKILLDRITNETETYNIITAKTIEKIKEEIRICISPQGMDKNYLVKSINNDLDVNIEGISKCSFIGENIKIIITGAMRRVGTTTTAINIASYLSSIGAKVSYTEANSNNHLIDIHSYYAPDIPIVDDYFFYEKVNYFMNANIPLEGYNFNIIDIGTLDKNNIKVFGIGDIKVLCGGNKPYEINKLKHSIELIDFKDERLYILLPDGQVLDIRKKLPINQDQVFNAKFSTNIFDKSINTDIWNSILNKYIVKPKAL